MCFQVISLKLLLQLVVNANKKNHTRAVTLAYYMDFCVLLEMQSLKSQSQKFVMHKHKL